MNRHEILTAVAGLAKTSGFYGRLFNAIVDNDYALELLESQNFSDVVDLVMFVEYEL